MVIQIYVTEEELYLPLNFLLTTTRHVQEETKQAKQEAKLALATEKRQAYGDTTAAFYRTLKTASVNDLPTKYSGNNVVDNANSGGLKNGRPWS